uniref:Uncharacterized protein n=1 Tax=Panagrolaimus superbus TaxID=310955 RepID=A0A914YIW0_9BILA
MKILRKIRYGMHVFMSDDVEVDKVDKGRKILEKNLKVDDKRGYINYIAIDTISPMEDIYEDKRESVSNFIMGEEVVDVADNPLSSLDFNIPPGNEETEQYSRVFYNGCCNSALKTVIGALKTRVAAHRNEVVLETCLPDVHLKVSRIQRAMTNCKCWQRPVTLLNRVQECNCVRFYPLQILGKHSHNLTVPITGGGVPGLFAKAGIDFDFVRNRLAPCTTFIEFLGVLEKVDLQPVTRSTHESGKNFVKNKILPFWREVRDEIASPVIMESTDETMKLENSSTAPIIAICWLDGDPNAVVQVDDASPNEEEDVVQVDDSFWEFPVSSPSFDNLSPGITDEQDWDVQQQHQSRSRFSINLSFSDDVESGRVEVQDTVCVESGRVDVHDNVGVEIVQRLSKHFQLVDREIIDTYKKISLVITKNYTHCGSEIERLLATRSMDVVAKVESLISECRVEIMRACKYGRHTVDEIIWKRNHVVEQSSALLHICILYRQRDAEIFDAFKQWLIAFEERFEEYQSHTMLFVKGQNEAHIEVITVPATTVPQSVHTGEISFGAKLIEIVKTEMDEMVGLRNRVLWEHDKPREEFEQVRRAKELENLSLRRLVSRINRPRYIPGQGWAGSSDAFEQFHEEQQAVQQFVERDVGVQQQVVHQIVHNYFF